MRQDSNGLLRLIPLFWAVYFGFAGFPGIVVLIASPHVDGPRVIFILDFMLVPLLLAIIAWRWRLVVGILTVVYIAANVLYGVLSHLTDEEAQYPPFFLLLIMLCFFIAAFLYRMMRRQERETKTEKM